MATKRRISRRKPRRSASRAKTIARVGPVKVKVTPPRWVPPGISIGL